VLAGRPNAGKSSLFNALTGRTGAIVSDQPGTTRDYLTAELDLDGVRCQLIDTAGISEGLGAGGLETRRCQATDIDLKLQGKGAASVQAAAEAKSHEQLRTAEIQLLCKDAEVRASLPDTADELPSPRPCVHGARPLPGTGEGSVASSAEPGKRLIIVRTKCDWIDPAERQVGPTLEVSAVTRAGIPRLREAIRAAVLEAAGPQTEIVVGTAVRCGESLRLTQTALQRAREAVQGNFGEELIAAEVRAALTEIGKVAGAVYTEDVLDSIFIGK
jgi:tRNA modification GTPase